MLHAEVFIDPAFYLTTPTFAFNTLKTQYPEQAKKISNCLVKRVQRLFVCVFFICATRHMTYSLWETK